MKHNTFEWTESCQNAFNTLKSITGISGPEVMAYPQNEGIFILDRDASDLFIGAVLSQIQDNQERVKSYASRALGKSEINYCVTDKELLAVKHFIKYFRQYLNFVSLQFFCGVQAVQKTRKG